MKLEHVSWSESPRISFAFLAFAVRNLLFSRYPLNVDKDFDPRLRAKVESLVNSHRFDLVVCDFVQMARNVLGSTAQAFCFNTMLKPKCLPGLLRAPPGPFRRT